jgi:hypothetical protein
MMLGALVLTTALGVVSAAPLTSSDAELVSAFVATAATKDARLDVLSAADVRNAVDLEAQRAVMGCDATSCLLEVAGAMDARLVVHGTLGTLGDVVVLTLNVFDIAAARALGRVVVQKQRVDALADAIGPAVVELLERAPTPTPGTRIRTVVLDVKLTAPPPAQTSLPVDDGAFPWLAVGGAAAGAGVIALLVGGTFDAIAVSEAARGEELTTPASEVTRINEARPGQAAIAITGYLVGGVLVAAGATALVVGVLE